VVQAMSDSSLLESGRETENWLGCYGAVDRTLFYFPMVWYRSIFIPPLLFVLDSRLFLTVSCSGYFHLALFSIFNGLWLCLLLGYMTLVNEGTSEWSFLGGGLGYQLAVLSEGMFGWGTFLILILSLFVFIIFFLISRPFLHFNQKIPSPWDRMPLWMNTETRVKILCSPITPMTKTIGRTRQKDEPVPQPVLLVKPPVQEPVLPAKDLKLEIEKPEPVKKNRKPSLRLSLRSPLLTPINLPSNWWNSKVSMIPRWTSVTINFQRWSC
jgi:S-DNA-T family DNA segregation ATPase FtsK/SpoIIIE